MTAPEPTGVTYARFRGKFGVAIVLADVAALVRDILERSTLYDYAAQQPGARVFQGRGPVYAIPLGPHQAVVRHSRHGGLLARWTSDVFLGRTRAHYELAVALQLKASGVRTPDVIGYVRYDAGPFLRRADVITREIANAIPLETALGLSDGMGWAGQSPAPTTASTTSRSAAWDAATELCQALGKAGAYHRDLNARNVLLTSKTSDVGDSLPSFDAYALDVDRVVWGVPGDPALAQANIRRVQRSARKLGLL